MCRQAICRILYEEEQGSMRNNVKVIVRRWDSERFKDVVIHQVLKEDGKFMVYSTTAEDGRAQSDAKLIRRGVKLFDGLVARHPILEPKSESEEDPDDPDDLKHWPNHHQEPEWQ